MSCDGEKPHFLQGARVRVLPWISISPDVQGVLSSVRPPRSTDCVAMGKFARGLSTSEVGGPARVLRSHARRVQSEGRLPDRKQLCRRLRPLGFLRTVSPQARFLQSPRRPRQEASFTGEHERVEDLAVRSHLIANRNGRFKKADALLGGTRDLMGTGREPAAGGIMQELQPWHREQSLRDGQNVCAIRLQVPAAQTELLAREHTAAPWSPTGPLTST